MADLYLTRNQVQKELQYGAFTDPEKEKVFRRSALNDWLILEYENNLLRARIFELEKFGERIGKELDQQIEYSKDLELQLYDAKNQRDHFKNIANMYGEDLAKLNAYGDKK